jgi:hypothetical protein
MMFVIGYITLSVLILFPLMYIFDRDASVTPDHYGMIEYIIIGLCMVFWIIFIIPVYTTLFHPFNVEELK